MEATLKEIKELKDKLDEAEKNGMPIDNPGVIVLNQLLTALIADLTALRKQGKPFISHRD
jgi:hypothetical protein